MRPKEFRQLEIDPEFKALIRPLRREEYRQLELNLSIDGCREPLVAWGDIIVDGHNRYEICNRLGIPYVVCQIEFDSREAAIAWICSNQLGRRNITEETRKYLIGKQYEAEKIIGSLRNPSGNNQYSLSSCSQDEMTEANLPSSDSDPIPETGRRTAARLGKEYHLSPTTIQKYGRYSDALDSISQVVPDFVPQVLSGNYKISHENIVALSGMDENAIREMSQRIQSAQNTYVRYSEARKSITGVDGQKPGPRVQPAPAIKTMPSYDPDAEVASLTLTIPSWISSIDRAQSNADLKLVSKTARMRLEEALRQLANKAFEMLEAVREDS